MKATAILSLALLTPLCAQTPVRHVPDSASQVEGSSSSAFPFAYTYGRTQQILRGSAVTSGSAVINQLAYRRDAGTNGQTLFQGVNYSNVDLRIGTTTVTPETMSTSFAANVTSSPTQVLSGSYSLPTLPPIASGPAPFAVTFTLQRPAIFAQANGHLLIDLTLPGTATKAPYFLDAEWASGSGVGRVNPYGVGGKFSYPETYRMSADPSTLKPGGGLDIRCSSFANQYTGTLVLGASGSSWGGIPLPLDLGLIGAPGNQLYVSMDVQVPFSTFNSSRNYISQLKSPIPAGASPGLTFYAQAYYLDAAANSAGLVATEALALTLDSTGALPEFNQVSSWDATATQGSWLFNNAPGGCVVRMIGSF